MYKPFETTTRKSTEIHALETEATFVKVEMKEKDQAIVELVLAVVDTHPEEAMKALDHVNVSNVPDDRIAQVAELIRNRNVS